MLKIVFIIILELSIARVLDQRLPQQIHVVSKSEIVMYNARCIVDCTYIPVLLLYLQTEASWLGEWRRQIVQKINEQAARLGIRRATWLITMRCGCDCMLSAKTIIQSDYCT